MLNISCKQKRIKLFCLALGLIATLFYYSLVSEQAFASNHTLTVTSSGAQNIDISGANNNSVISSDTITVSTTCRSGYNFTINTSVTDNNLYLNGNSSNNTTGQYFTPATGNTALNDSTNTWGYYYDGSTTPTRSTNFNPVPALGNTAIIKSQLLTPSPTDINDSFNIYYGVSASGNLSPGTYKMIPDTNNSNLDGTIVYTTTIAEACISYIVNYNPTGTNTGTAITGSGIVADQTIHEGIATNLTTDTFTNPVIDGNTYYFAGWNTAQDGSGTSYAPGQSVTDLTVAGNTITLYAQWTTCPNNSICYEANGNNTEGTVGVQKIESSDTKAILMPSNFSRTGYGFAGWSDSPNPDIEPNAKLYGPNESITFDAGRYSNGGLILYAVWVASEGTLQDSTKIASLCGANGALNTAPTDGTANLSSISALTDNRDNQTYAIAKLADGNCWMIENLRLDNTATLTTTNTNNPLNNNDTTNPIVTLKHNYIDTETHNTLSASSSIAYNETTAPEGWCNTSTPECFEQSRFNSVNTVNRVTYTEGQTMSKTDHFYSYGNYYNWYSATAGRGVYNTYKDNTVGDLCPKGWKMPYGNSGTYGTNLGGTSGGFSYLDTRLGGNGTAENTEAASLRWRKFPNNFIFSGWIHSDARYSSLGVTGIYWTRTSYTYQNSHYLYFSKSEVNAGLSNGDKGIGLPVRCLVSI